MTKLKEYKMYINGNWVDAENKKTFKSLNPENNEPWAVVPEASAKDVNKAVEAAQKAFDGSWPKLMPRERANFLKAILTSSAHSILQRCFPFFISIKLLPGIILFKFLDISGVDPTSFCPVVIRVLALIFFNILSSST